MSAHDLQAALLECKAKLQAAGIDAQAILVNPADVARLLAQFPKGEVGEPNQIAGLAVYARYEVPSGEIRIVPMSAAFPRIVPYDFR